MHRVQLFRVVAFVIALLGSLSAPAQALAHGLVHEHLAGEHGDPHHDADHHESATAETAGTVVASSGEAHSHAHPTFDVVSGTREQLRLPLAPAGRAIVPAPVAMHAVTRVIRAPERTDRVLLARPDPERGPPPSLRAPPIS